MTAETLKSFIRPATSNISQRRNARDYAVLGLTATFIILTATLLGFSIWNSIRVSKLQTEVTALTRLAESMQKRLGLDYLDDINEFEKEYSTDNDSSEENILLADRFGHIDEKDYIDNEEDDIGFDGSGFGDEDDEIIDNYDEDSLYQDYEKFKHEKKRKTRSISTSNGIPVYHDSYAMKRARTGGPEDDRILRHLMHEKSPQPTLRYDWNDKSSRHEDKDSDASATNKFRTPGYVHKYRNHIKRQHQANSLKQRHLRPMLKSGKLRNKPLSLTAAAVQKTIAVHYFLNSTISGSHNFHPGTVQLPHDGDIYIGSPHPWARDFGVDKAFDVNHGFVTIKESGIYFVYSQIFYDNSYDKNGYRVYHNDYPFLQCAVTVPTNMEKSNTCYTSGVIYLNVNDTVHLRDVFRDRTVILRNAKSFFGLIKLGDV